MAFLGFVFPTRGKGWILGRDILTPIARRRIGYLPEAAYYYRYLTAREILSMYGRLFGLGGRTLKGRVAEVLEIVGLREAADVFLRQYSKGMLQRVGLAQALVNDPDLLILDEPTSGLDPLGRMKIRSLIRELKERGKTIFFSSHDSSFLPLADLMNSSRRSFMLFWYSCTALSVFSAFDSFCAIRS